MCIFTWAWWPAELCSSWRMSMGYPFSLQSVAAVQWAYLTLVSNDRSTGRHYAISIKSQIPGSPEEKEVEKLGVRGDGGYQKNKALWINKADIWEQRVWSSKHWLYMDVPGPLWIYYRFSLVFLLDTCLWEWVGLWLFWMLLGFFSSCWIVVATFDMKVSASSYYISFWLLYFQFGFYLLESFF